MNGMHFLSDERVSAIHTLIDLAEIIPIHEHLSEIKIFFCICIMLGSFYEEDDMNFLVD